MEIRAQEIHGRRVRGHRVYVGRSEEIVGYAPVKWTVCVSPNGYKRRRHEYLLEDHQGKHCLWCGRIRPWEPIS